ncbi:MAG: Asp23/Gls24 family envelope stress response protein [Spirochaetales bacterium]|nr:Asp23/Gls24 family envelope stress response protein [Spirochaetales bacterium]MCF7937154.1 Asp23/Gls24 family envelope stress response protein [Spirochaetales bacterium]
MRKLIHHVIWLIRGVKVFSLTGRSGTGKSFRARLIAEKYGIPLIIDDGLLIREDRILAGKSAKKESGYLEAVRTALFDKTQHRDEVRKALESERFKRILVLGTSERMVKKITSRLGLPAPSKSIDITDVASEDEINIAINSRNTEGKHVIPVPSLEVRQRLPAIFHDSVRVLLNKRFSLGKKQQFFEKSVVRPNYTKRGKVIISEAALAQMALHCVDEYDKRLNIKKISVKQDLAGDYRMDLHIQVPFGLQLSESMQKLQHYIVDSIERFTGIYLQKVNVVIGNVSDKKNEKK